MKLKMLEATDRTTFVNVVNDFIRDRKLFSVKFQRNLYYSLSGSTHYPQEMAKETSTLKESYIAFIVYEEGRKHEGSLCRSGALRSLLRRLP